VEAPELKPGVYIAQLLCPARHAVLAAAGFCRDRARVHRLAGRVDRKFRELTAAGKLDPCCGLCRSRDLRIEAARTRFATMEEALPHLNAPAEAQRAGAAFWNAAGIER
jgi:hypothetical protein